MLMTNPYYEVMAIGNVLLPEDLSYLMLKFSNITSTYAPEKSIGVWGTILGGETQVKMKSAGRPIIWANELNTKMIIDPVVNGLANNKITEDDVANFKKHWKPNPGLINWEELILSVPLYLQLHFQTYDTRSICADIEANPLNNVLGIDGEGDCVYWTSPTPTSPKWECMNDGTCEQSTTTINAKAIYDSQLDCLSLCANNNWTCVKNIKNASDPSAKYCVPNSAGEYPNLGSCEDDCFVSS